MFTDDPEKVRAILSKMRFDEELTNEDEEIIQRYPALRNEFVAMVTHLRRFDTPQGESVDPASEPDPLIMAIGLSLNKVIAGPTRYDMEALLWLSRLLDTDGRRFLFFQECVSVNINRSEFSLTEELLELLRQELNRSDQKIAVGASARNAMCFTCASQANNGAFFDQMIAFLKMMTDGEYKRRGIESMAANIWTRQAQYNYLRSQQRPHVVHFFESLEAWHPQAFKKLDEIIQTVQKKVNTTP